MMAGRRIPGRGTRAAAALAGLWLASGVAGQAVGPAGAGTGCSAERAGRAGPVQMQLVEAALRLRLEDAQVSHRPLLGCLAPNRSVTLPAPLPAGSGQTLVAVCDKARCDDIDLVVYDDARRVVGADVGVGAEARVDLSPPWAGEYVLRVFLPACRDADCAFAVGLFSRPPRK